MNTIEELTQAMFSYSKPAQPFSVQTFDLTSARTEFLVSFSTCRFVQAICDGGMDGISVKLQEQSNYSVNLNQINTIASGGTTRLFLTNDVRSGRSKLTLIFHFILPGERYLGGEGISRAEQAARLGSIDTFDRRGEIVFIDDFEDGIKWFEGGTGATIALSNAYANSKALSIKLLTAATTDRTAFIQKILPIATEGKYSLEIATLIADATNLKDFYIELQYNDGAINYAGRVKYDHVNSILLYFNTGGTWTEFATGIAYTVLLSYFRKVKLVIDLSSKKYVRAIFNGNEYDLSGCYLKSTASITEKYLTATALITTATNVALVQYFDDVLVKSNEP